MGIAITGSDMLCKRITEGFVQQQESVQGKVFYSERIETDFDELLQKERINREVPGSWENTQAVRANKVESSVIRGKEECSRLENVMKEFEEMHNRLSEIITYTMNGRQFNAQELLAFQAEMHRITNYIEMV